MPVRPKSGSKPYRDELRASLQALGAHEPRLTELVACDLQQGNPTAPGMARCRRTVTAGGGGTLQFPHGEPASTDDREPHQ